MSHVYRAVWEIADDDRPMSALIAEACAALDTMAARDGARLVGEPRWTVAGDRLVCEVPAVPVEPLDVAADRQRRDVEVRRLAGLHWSHRQIGAVLGVPHSTVRDILAREVVS